MKIKKTTLMWIIIAILLLAVVFLAFKEKISSTGNAGKIDTKGWTENEIMNYEMHGTIPARTGKSSASNSMVGGC